MSRWIARRGGFPRAGEIILACVTSSWAVLLGAVSVPVGTRPVTAAVIDAAGGRSTFVVLLCILAVLQWLALLIEGWPPRLRALVSALVFAWWLFVTLVAVLVAPTSLVWSLLGAISALALVQCLDLVGEVARTRKGTRP